MARNNGEKRRLREALVAVLDWFEDLLATVESHQRHSGTEIMNSRWRWSIQKAIANAKLVLEATTPPGDHAHLPGPVPPPTIEDDDAAHDSPS